MFINLLVRVIYLAIDNIKRIIFTPKKKIEKIVDVRKTIYIHVSVLKNCRVKKYGVTCTRLASREMIF